jgi:hypothetical protein
MPYIAHAGIQLKDDYPKYNKNEWHFIKRVGEIEYKWRLCDDLTYDLIAGLFDDRKAALDCAKQLYVALFYDLFSHGFSVNDAGCSHYEPFLYSEQFDGDYGTWLANEEFFYRSKKKRGGSKTGPGVFEADNNIEEYAEYPFFHVSFGVLWEDGSLDFESKNERVFTYTKEAQSLLNTVATADSVSDFGLQMTLYCGLLEHLSDAAQKEPEVLQVLDQLIVSVNQFALSLEQKKALQNYLSQGKEQSSRQKIKLLCKKYAKPVYSQYKTDSIINKAYGARSVYSHGNKEHYNNEAAYIKLVALDVIKNYLLEKERVQEP